jgi:FkbM family methyltransferase
VSFVTRKALELAYARGFEIRRHPATRRQRMLERHGVDVVLDVGAADGGYGSQLRMYGYTGRIVSFEPLAGSYAALTARIAGDPAWTAHNVALGDAAGSAEINVASNGASSSLLPMEEAHRRAEPSVGYVGQETITVARLDDLAPDILAEGDRPFLKLDTQGYERAVLQGGAATLERCRGLQVELSFVSLYEGGMLVDEAISFAYDAGFHLVGIETGWAAPTGEMLQADGVFFRD